MEETENPNPAEEPADDTTAPDETPIPLWIAVEGAPLGTIADPAGWWKATVDEHDVVSLTKLAHVSAHNRPAGMTDSGDVTIVAPIDELLVRLRSLPYIEAGELVHPEVDDEDRPHAQGDAEALRSQIEAIRDALWLGPEESILEELQVLDTSRDTMRAQLDTIRLALGAGEDEDLAALVTAKLAALAPNGADQAALPSTEEPADEIPAEESETLQTSAAAESTPAEPLKIAFVANATIAALAHLGYDTLEKIRSAPDEALLAVEGVSEAVLAKLRKAADAQ